MFWTRLASGAGLVAAVMVLMFFGGLPLMAVFCAVAVVGMYELYRTAKIEKSFPAFASYVSGIILYVCNCYGRYQLLAMALILSIVFLLILYVIFYPKYDINNMTTLVFGMIYVAVFFSYIYKLRTAQGGEHFVWLIFIGAWGADTLAYCAGKLFGNRKLPGNLHKLSPNKTIEGILGGDIGAVLLAVIYGFIFFNGNIRWKFALIGLLAAFMSQLGDLAASAIKRNRDIKDYGKLIPGHGGILDRFDSILLVAPVVYYIMKYSV